MRLPECRTPCSSLLRLDDDSLLEILEKLSSRKDTIAYATTCRFMRSLCIPVIFRNLAMQLRHPPDIERLPMLSYQYVRRLELMDRCPDGRAMRIYPSASHDQWLVDHLLRYTDDPLLCGVLTGSHLRRILHSMPNLRAVCLILGYDETHAVSHDAVDTILSLPHLQEFNVDRVILSPRPPRDSPAPTLHWHPVSHFRYDLRPHRSEPRQYPSECEVLTTIIAASHQVLEVLHLPSEPAPIQLMLQFPWPRIRELRLSGHYPNDISIPIVTLISQMSELHVLALLFSLPPTYNAEPPTMWPSTHVPCSSWPYLRELTISHPNVHDKIYEHLPPSLTHLVLRCYPRYLVCNEATRDLRRTNPALSASGMLSILSRSRMPGLAHLDIEYRADAGEDSLLRQITHAFPRLTFIELHRIPTGNRVNSQDADEVAAKIARSLSSLNALEVFRLNQNLLWRKVPGLPSAIEVTAARAAMVLHILQHVKAVWLVYPSPIIWKWVRFFQHSPERNRSNVESAFDLANSEDYEYIRY